MTRYRSGIAAVLLVAGCATSDGGAGGPAGTAKATQNIENSSIGRDANNTANSGRAGAGGAGGTAKNAVDIRLALDPRAFANIFGTVPVADNPTDTQLEQVAGYAAATGNTILSQQARSCRVQGANCSVAPE